jgi:uncharacterized membrane protein YgaE (UPF0421/DUF939 family)
MEPVDRAIPAIPAISIPEDTRRLFWRSRVMAVAAFALAMVVASWIGDREPAPAMPPAILAWVP